MRNHPKEDEIEQKMKEEKEIDNKNIKNQIKDLLKCDICSFNFDLNIHMPMVAKCGHTYCKKCIYNGGKKETYGICPIDNIHHVLGIESCIPNLKLELIIKAIFNYIEPKIKEKKIICFNHEIKLNNNSIDKINDDKLFRSNSGNKNFFHHDEFFPNILIDKKNKTITNFKVNKDKQIRNLKLYNDNVDIIEELNVMNEDKINFSEKNKINDESIDTIPLNDDKSNANISFKDEFNELLNKNSEHTQKNTPKINEENIINNENNLNEKNIEKNNDKDKEKNNDYKDNKNMQNDIIDKNNENKENRTNNCNEHYKIELPSEIQRNSINFIQKNKKIKIDAIIEIDEYAIRPRTITVSKNNRIEEKIEKNKNSNKKEKIKEKNKDIYEIKKLSIYNKVSAKKRKPISQDNDYRNRKIELKKKAKTKSEEKDKEKLNNIKEINKNFEGSENKKEKNIKKENENNISDIYIEEEKKRPSAQKYRILSKKIGLKRSPEHPFNNSNSNFNNSLANCNNNSEEKIKFCRPAMKYKSSINTYFRANKLIWNNSDEQKNKTNLNFIANEISSFQKKKYIDCRLKNANDYSSNSYRKTKSTYNKKKLKGKSNLFLTAKNNYNISLNNSNNNINSNTIINNNNLITHNNLNKEENINVNNINRVKYSKISLSMSPDNKDNLENNNIHSTRDFNNFNNNFTACSKDINGIIKTITIKRVNSLATKNFTNQKNNNKIEEKNNNNDNNKINIEDFNEIKNKLRFEFNRVFNYQIDLYENLKEEKSKQILISRNKKYKSILEEFFNQMNNYDELKNTKICFLPDGELFIGQKELNMPKYGITYSLSGDYYKGSFINGKKDGNGIMIYKNGTRYEGSFKNNRHEGFGKLKQLDGETFIGEWKDGKINGNGVRCHCNGDRYIGSYVNNIRNGHGNYTFSNGDSYEGNWLNGKATGKGVFKFKNGDIYEGEFKENIIVGHGSFKTKNGDVYCGIFKNGLINGKGILKYQNGEKYMGYFQNGKKNGIGKIYDKNGKVYKSGYWKNDKYLGNKNI